MGPGLALKARLVRLKAFFRISGAGLAEPVPRASLRRFFVDILEKIKKNGRAFCCNFLLLKSVGFKILENKA